MSNIVIVGSGPAGVSAALYAVRAGVDTTVLTKGPGALDRAEKIENYYGLAQPVSVAIISIFVVTYYAAAPQSCSDSGQVLIQVISIIRNEICSYPQTLYITICSYQRWQIQKSLVNIRKWHRYQALQSIYTVCSG